MSRPTVTIHNIETNEIETREMNHTEFAQWELDQANRASAIVAEADKEALRQEVLNRLGITEDEARSLLG